VEIVPFGASDPHCPGTSRAPTTTAGFPCLYIRTAVNVTADLGGVYYVATQELGNLGYGASPLGVRPTAQTVVSGEAAVIGPWAVTAP
jgi:hypothetical protein